MIYGANLSIIIMDNQQPSPEQGKAQRLSKTLNITLDKENKMQYNIIKILYSYEVSRVHFKRSGNGGQPNFKVEDIV